MFYRLRGWQEASNQWETSEKMTAAAPAGLGPFL
jgi:hypothetical protein